jgi:folate-binding protein YgfZ
MRFVVDASSRARVLVTGPDGPAFLHRMSTQHTAQLAVGDARLNVLTTDKGRIFDVVHQIVLAEGVLVVGTAKGTADVIGWLDRYFFTEKLALEDASDGSAVIVDGATAEALVPGAVALAPWQALRAGSRVAVRTFDVADRDGAAVACFIVVGLARDAGLPVPTSTPDEIACAAVAAGVPTNEVGDAMTPLDLALHDAIHWAKGCYIGQEVIARLDTYGKQRRQLVGVVVDPLQVSVGDEVVVGDAVVGAVTSSAPAAWCAALPSALALVRGVDPGAEGVVGEVRARDGRRAPARLTTRRAAQAPHG